MTSWVMAVEQDIKDLAKTRSLKLERNLERWHKVIHNRPTKHCLFRKFSGFKQKFYGSEFWFQAIFSLDFSFQENISLGLRVVHNRERYEMI